MLGGIGTVHASGSAGPTPDPFAVPPSCRALADPIERLACFDRSAEPAEKLAGPRTRSGVTLSQLWELEPADKRGTFVLQPHQANYFLPFHWTNERNLLPSTPAPGHTVTDPLAVQAFESKFQFSVKLKVAEGLIGDNGDLWVAYTQQSNWQLYNTGASSPFRETNYQPELIFGWRTGLSLGPWRWSMLNLGLLHESNGRPLPSSRSWNRLYAQFGIENDSWTLLVRPWWRVPESAEDDDNPDIGAYMGWGDLRIAYARGGNVWSVLGRYSFSGDRGYVQFDWAFPISGSLKGYLQLSSGYGESLLDYNHGQTTVALGLLLLPWR